MRRREFLATLGTAAAAVATAPLASAQFSEQPDHVTIESLSEARADIETYQPLLDLSALEIRPSDQYAWKLTSTEYEFDYYEYWTFYSAQAGATAEDSHLPDREPVYVLVDDSGAVDRIIISEWHYSARVVDEPELYESTHPQLEVISPWHGTTPTDASGEFVSLADFKSEYPDWLTAGWGVDRESVVDPAIVEDRGNWWPEEDQRNHDLAVWWHDLGLDWNPWRLDEGGA